MCVMCWKIYCSAKFIRGCVFCVWERIFQEHYQLIAVISCKNNFLSFPHSIHWFCILPLFLLRSFWMVEKIWMRFFIFIFLKQLTINCESGVFRFFCLVVEMLRCFIKIFSILEIFSRDSIGDLRSLVNFEESEIF